MRYEQTRFGLSFFFFLFFCRQSELKYWKFVFGGDANTTRDNGLLEGDCRLEIGRHGNGVEDG